jgi:hypothetical protein
MMPIFAPLCPEETHHPRTEKLLDSGKSNPEEPYLKDGMAVV